MIYDIIAIVGMIIGAGAFIYTLWVIGKSMKP